MCLRRLRMAMVWLPRGRSSWAVPLLLFLAVLLVAGLAFNLANLDTGGEAIPAVPSGGSTPTSSRGLLSSVLMTYLLQVVVIGFLSIGFVLILYHQWKQKYQRKRKFVARRRARSVWDMLGALLGLALMTFLLVLWPRVADTAQGDAPANGDNGTASTGMEGLPSIAGLPPGLFLALSLLGAILVLVFFLRRGTIVRRTPEVQAPPEGEREAAAEAVQATIEELRLGEDVRTAILACYERFCALLGARGVSDQAPLTPRELERFAVEQLQVPEDGAEALTGLFEEARYSVHALGDADRVRALDSLERIRASLGA